MSVSKVVGTSVEKMEAQAWICLYNLLSCKEVMDKYQINDFRVGVLIKLQSRSTFLHLHILNESVFFTGFMTILLTSCQS